jgi:TPR repeat protein
MSQCRLGRCYADGIGVTANIQESGRWYRMAAKQGNVHGQYKNLVRHEMPEKELREMQYEAVGDMNGTGGRQK